MIVAENVSKWFGAHAAVRELTFEAPKGALIGLLGLNGAGKTTTLRMLAGLTAPTSGRLTLAGHEAASTEARAVVGYLPDRAPLWPDMRVRAFVRHAAKMRGVRESAAAVERALETCGLREVADEPLATLSHGYRQRVGLAQALVHDPAVLVLDEPIQGLDPEQIGEMRATLERLRGERTIVLSTHILGEVARSCDHLLVLHEGRVAVSGAKDEVLGEERVLEIEVRGEEDAVRRALAGVSWVVVETETALRATTATETETALRAMETESETETESEAETESESETALRATETETETALRATETETKAKTTSGSATTSVKGTTGSMSTLRIRMEISSAASVDETAERVASALVGAGLGLRSLTRPRTGDLEALFARLRRSR